MLQLKLKYSDRISFQDFNNLPSDWNIDDESYSIIYHEEGDNNILDLGDLEKNTDYRFKFEVINDEDDEFDDGFQIYTGPYSTTIDEIGEYNFVKNTDNYTQFQIYPYNDTSKFGIKNIEVEKLYFEPVDLFEDKDNIALNFSLLDIREINERSYSFSKSIRVPGTDRNNKFFKYIFEINSDNLFNVNKKIEAEITDNNNKIIDGYIQLVEIYHIKNQNMYEYEIVFYGKGANIFQKLKDVKLEDLDLSELDHNLTDDNIGDSWLRSFSDPDNLNYVYPFIDYGRGLKNYYRKSIFKPVDMTGLNISDYGIYKYDLYPAPTVKFLFDKIFDYAGFTYSGSTFINSNEFKSLILPYCRNDKEMVDEWQLMIEYKMNNKCFVTNYQYLYYGGIKNGGYGYMGDYGYFDNSSNDNVIPTIYANEFVNILRNEKKSILVGDIINEYNMIGNSLSYTLVNRTVFKTPEDGNYKIELDITITDFEENTSFIHKPDVLLYRQEVLLAIGKSKNGTYNKELKKFSEQEIHLDKQFVATPSTSIPYLDENLPPCVSPPCTVTLSSGVVELKKGDIVFPKIYPFLSRCYYKVNSFKVYSKQRVKGTPQYGKDFVPDMTCNDLLKNIINMFNLYFLTDKENEKQINFYTREEFFNLGEEKDWNQKIDYDQTLKNIIPSDLQNKFYKLSYKDADDFYNETYKKNKRKLYGSKSIEFDNDFIKDEKSYELDFAPLCIREASLNNNPTGETYFYYSSVKDEDNDDYSTETEQRIAYFKYYDLKNKTPFQNYPTRKFLLEGEIFSFPYAGHLEYPYNKSSIVDNVEYSGITNDLNFDTDLPIFIDTADISKKNLYNRFYRQQINEINSKKSRLLECYVHLDNNDIREFNYNDIIYAENAIWSVNKIYDYKPYSDSPTKVELFKINAVNSDYSETETSPGGFESADGLIRRTGGEDNSGGGGGNINIIDLGENNNYDFTSVGDETSNTGIIVGDDITIVDGAYDNSALNSSDVTINSGSINNTVNNSTNVVLEGNNSSNVVVNNSTDVTVESGLTNVFVVNSSGITVTESNTIIMDGVTIKNGKIIEKDGALLIDCGKDTVQYEFYEPRLIANQENKNWNPSYKDGNWLIKG